MALVRPIAQAEKSFDAMFPHTFTFKVNGGDRVIGNILTIRLQSDNSVVYKEKVETYSFSHTIPKNVLENNIRYNAYFNTYDADNNISEDSNVITFQCLTTPKFNFTNIPKSNIIESNSYTFNVQYKQDESELVNGVVFYLYDEFETEIADASYNGTDIVNGIFSHTFNGFDNNTIYKIKATVYTVNGLVTSTPLETFVARYNYPETFSLLDLDNDCKDNCVRINSNVIVADGHINPLYEPDKFKPWLHIENPSVFDLDSCIEWNNKAYPYETDDLNQLSEWSILLFDVHEQENYVEWTDGFSIGSDFTLTVFLKDGVIGKTMQLGDVDNGYTITMIREYPYGEDYTTSNPKDVLELRGYVNGELKVVQRSNYTDIINQLSYYMIWIRKQGDKYDIKLKVLERGISELNWVQKEDNPDYVMWDIPFSLGGETIEETLTDYRTSNSSIIEETTDGNIVGIEITPKDGVSNATKYIGTVYDYLTEKEVELEVFTLNEFESYNDMVNTASIDFYATMEFTMKIDGVKYDNLLIMLETFTNTGEAYLSFGETYRSERIKVKCRELDSLLQRKSTSNVITTTNEDGSQRSSIEIPYDLLISNNRNIKDVLVINNEFDGYVIKKVDSNSLVPLDSPQRVNLTSEQISSILSLKLFDNITKVESDYYDTIITYPLYETNIIVVPDDDLVIASVWDVENFNNVPNNHEFERTTDYTWYGEETDYPRGGYVKEFAEDMDKAFPLETVRLYSGLYDHLDITSDVSFSFETFFKINPYLWKEMHRDWDYHTRLNCDFQDNIRGGNIDIKFVDLRYIRFKRRKKGTFDWITIKEVEIKDYDDLIIALDDYFVPTHYSAEYALVPVMEGGVEGQYIMSGINTIFNGFTIADLNKAFNLRAEVTYGGDTRNSVIGTYQPLSGKYPIMQKTSELDYVSGSFTATMLGYNFDESRRADRFDINRQTNDLCEFLNDNKAKVIKDWNGMIRVVRFMGNPTVSYVDKYGNGITQVTGQWVEQGKFDNQEDLYANGLI